MGGDGRRWYLKPTSREKVKAAITAEEGSYRGVAQRLRLRNVDGVSYATLHRIAAGETKSSSVIPDLLRYLDMPPAEHIDLELGDGEDLTDEQITWLGLLSDLKKAGMDPADVEASVRTLVKLALPKTK
jgi:hypothetical protein